MAARAHGGIITLSRGDICARVHCGEESVARRVPGMGRSASTAHSAPHPSSTRPREYAVETKWMGGSPAWPQGQPAIDPQHLAVDEFLSRLPARKATASAISAGSA